jgi:hypothetical protein
MNHIFREEHMSKVKFGWRLAASGALAGAGLIGLAGLAGAQGPNLHGPPSTLTYPTPGGPVPAFPPISPPAGALQGSGCPFDDTALLQFVPGEGNGVIHLTSNNNGDWGGGTGTGPGEITDSTGNTVFYTGQLTEWGGGGNNAKGQTVNGFTLTFTGSGPDGTITITGNSHQTTNAAGTPTANVNNLVIVCTPLVS